MAITEKREQMTTEISWTSPVQAFVGYQQSTRRFWPYDETNPQNTTLLDACKITHYLMISSSQQIQSKDP